MQQLEILVDASRHMANLAVYERELVVADAVHEVAVVRDEQDRPRPGVEQVLEQHEHVGVEVVARLVEQQHVGLVEQDEHELQPAPLAA